eukprot:3792267-Pleurochrysis_carterae.AAC.1
MVKSSTSGTLAAEWQQAPYPAEMTFRPSASCDQLTHTRFPAGSRDCEHRSLRCGWQRGLQR